MKLLDINENKVTVKISAGELASLCNALNEVCHGFKLSEFEK
jgi:hypothetical protein